MFDPTTLDRHIGALGKAYAASQTNMPWLRHLRSVSKAEYAWGVQAAEFQLGTASPFLPSLTTLIRHATSCTSVTVALEALV